MRNGRGAAIRGRQTLRAAIVFERSADGGGHGNRIEHGGGHAPPIPASCALDVDAAATIGPLPSTLSSRQQPQLSSPALRLRASPGELSSDAQHRVG